MKQINFIIVVLLVLSTSSVAQANVYDLKKCLTLAEKNNHKIKEKQLEVVKAEEVKKEAFTRYFPKIEASAFAMRANKGLIEGEVPEMNLPVYDGNPASLQNPAQFAYFPGMSIHMLDSAKMIAVTAIQPVFAGGKIINGNRLARLGVEISNEQLLLSKEEVRSNTETYFWTIVALQEKKKTLASYEKLLNNLQKDVNVSYEAGLIQKSDVLKVQLELNKISIQKLHLSNNLTLLKKNMSVIMGVPYDKTMEFRDDYDHLKKPQMVLRDKNEALEARVEHRLLLKAVEAKTLQKKMELGEILPTMFIGAQALGMDMMDNSMWRGVLFAGITVPISDWWGGAHKLRAQNAEISMARNALQEKSELLQLQMEQDYNNLVESYQQIELETLTVAQCKEHLKVVRDNFDGGILGMSDLLEAQAMVQKAEDTLVDAKTGYKINLSAYLKSSAQR
ncbi:MAG: TolC family protein [Deltaproteobacteria bacterium]|nr:TolC family protein [Deltaproteobacteria bacterium]